MNAIQGRPRQRCDCRGEKGRHTASHRGVRRKNMRKALNDSIWVRPFESEIRKITTEPTATWTYILRFPELPACPRFKIGKPRWYYRHPAPSSSFFKGIVCVCVCSVYRYLLYGKRSDCEQAKRDTAFQQPLNFGYLYPFSSELD